MRYLLLPIIPGVQPEKLDKRPIQDFALKLRSQFPDALRGFIVPKIIDWEDLVHDRQMEAFAMDKDRPRQKLLMWKHTLGSDILWGLRTRATEGEKTIEDEVYDFIDAEIVAAVEKLGADNTDVCVIAHSHGGQRAFTYTWDAKYPVTGLITMGTEITMVSGTFKDWGRPSPALKFWDNYLMKFDMIGSDFKYHKSESLRKLVRQHDIWSIDPRTLMTLGAHGYYWKHDGLIREVAETISREYYSI